MEVERQPFEMMGAGSGEAEPDPPAVGQWLRLDVNLRADGLWIGPAWAVVCGIIASGQFTWNGRGLLLAGLVFFLVEGVWATLWTAAVETDWATIVARWGSGARAPALRRQVLPYTRPGAPADRAARWLSHLAHWWQTDLQPVAGVAASSIGLCLALGAALAAVLGWPLLVLSAAALALVQLGLVVNRASGRPAPAPRAALEVGLAWLAGQAAFEPVTLLSALMAATFATAYAGGLQLLQQCNGLGNWRWSQLIVALLLVIAHRPLSALLLFFILFAQWLLEPALQRGRSGAWFVRSNQAWLMAAMLVVAFTLAAPGS